MGREDHHVKDGDGDGDDSSDAGDGDDDPGDVDDFGSVLNSEAMTMMRNGWKRSYPRVGFVFSMPPP